MPAPGPPVAEQPANGPDAKPQPPPPPPLQVQIIESAADAEHTQEREAKSDKHEAEDLDAQVRAANAAEKQVRFAWVTTFLTFAGTVLLIWNLTEARKANSKIRGGKIYFPQMSRGVLGATQPGVLRAELDRPINEEAWASLQDGTKAIYVYRELGYHDAFGKHWLMEYIYFCGGAADTKSIYIFKMVERERERPDQRVYSAGPLEIPLSG